ncbi:HAD family hydrolase [Nonomuraea wenchangensis]|uniref:Haloacid dehalogenase superfamily, subfamily IA, variant 3 with third motif having DD or ED n=1 Tax=Nonomuraea wenchangensis TaxID=568860 RepID=A0A1I0A8L8_9ACTN|nr:HAD family phosphatase [Nonomuraea wenchangensis]SES90542.1 haloacid dehalogenase superfamily, subfamily IA, variant 3 with third motif having DD or ED [Nonomuraea wenchangensis]
MRPQLVIFDNDGVLVDSEPTAHRVLSEYLTELGFPFTLEESYRYFLGNAARTVHTVVADRYGGTLPADFTARCHERVFTAFKQGLDAVQGASTVLTELRRRGFPYCLASSSDHAWIDLTLDRTGLRPLLPSGVVFSAQDVGGVGKPAPDLFLHAAAAFGADPRDCLVVEDSPNGVRAAKAAGMPVVGYAAVTPARRLAGATSLITRLTEILDHLDQDR